MLSSLLFPSRPLTSVLPPLHLTLHRGPSRMKPAPRQGRRSSPSLSSSKITPHRARKPLATAAFLPSAVLVAILWLCALVQAAPQAATSSSGTGQNATTSAQGGGSNSTNTTVVPLGTRAHHGLGDDWMQVNSIYIGFLPDWSR